MTRRTKKISSTAAGVGIVAVFLAALGVGIYQTPFLTDWLLYSDVDSKCGGVFTFDAQRVDAQGRHCFIGPRRTDGDMGFVDIFDVASGGSLLVYADKGAQGAERHEVRLAVLQPPGRAGQWFCAGGGTYWDGGFDLRGLRAVEASADTSEDVEIEVTASGKVVEGEFDGEEVRGRLLSGSCRPDGRRCELRFGHEGSSLRVIFRTWIGVRTADHREIELEEGMLVYEHGLTPESVKVAIIGPESGSTLAWTTTSDLITLKLRGVQAPAVCSTSSDEEAGVTGFFER